MAKILKLVSDKPPVPCNENVRCWLFHKWSKWMLLKGSQQARQCTKCGFTERKTIW